MEELKEELMKAIKNISNKTSATHEELNALARIAEVIAYIEEIKRR